MYALQHVSKQFDRWNSVWKNTQNAIQATSQRHPGYIFGSVVFTHKLRHAHAFFEYDNRIEFCKGDQDLSEYVKNGAENQF